MTAAHGEMSTVGPPARHRYSEELEQLRLQVEVMGLRVDANLERARQVLRLGDEALAAQALAADDEVDAMNLSLIERCYALLAREGPVASDLRLIVSVVKVLDELERVGDLALRVVKAGTGAPVLAEHPRIHDVLVVMADEAIERYRAALDGWAQADVDRAAQVAAGSPVMELLSDQLAARLLELGGRPAVPVAIRATAAAKALDRIADHAAIVGARVRYLVTGEPQFLAAEVR